MNTLETYIRLSNIHLLTRGSTVSTPKLDVHPDDSGKFIVVLYVKGKLQE